MPVTPTYPGVYIEEVPSGVHTITGVATSIAAFVGRAKRGPIEDPKMIHGFAEFERVFGGLWSSSSLGFALRDFFSNGGSDAIIVRLYKDDAGGSPKTTAKMSSNGITVNAASKGSWGNTLRFRLVQEGSPTLATDWGVATTDLFTLYVLDGETKSVEIFRNVTQKESPRRIDRVLKDESKLVRADTPANPPATAISAHPAPTNPTSDVWTDDTLSTKVADADKATDGQALDTAAFGTQGSRKGMFALDTADLFNLLIIPPYTAAGGVGTDVIGLAGAYCEQRRAMLLLDPPAWADKDAAKTAMANPQNALGTASKNAAVFFPMLMQRNPLHDGQLESFPPAGAIAGVFARTDAQRGVWKAPAGLEATLVGVPELSVVLTDPENGELNPLGVNSLRAMQGVGPVVWGARTLVGSDRLASEWKYLPVRRTALFLEESLFRGTQWVVFEPNDEPLWSQIRLNVGAFMHTLFRQGAFAGMTPREAYFVKCDKDTTTQDDVNRGVVNVLVGFAPLKPAEFVMVKIQQMAGQIAV
jgi:Bacteriophage tail sheath protein